MKFWKVPKINLVGEGLEENGKKIKFQDTMFTKYIQIQK